MGFSRSLHLMLVCDNDISVLLPATVFFVVVLNLHCPHTPFVHFSLFPSNAQYGINGKLLFPDFEWSKYSVRLPMKLSLIR